RAVDLCSRWGGAGLTPDRTRNHLDHLSRPGVDEPGCPLSGSRAHRGQSGSDQMCRQLLLRRIELDSEGVDEFRGRLLRAQRPDALTRAPDVAPGLRLRIRVGAEVHLR